MKLLIVDDEILTRTGVVASVDWNSLGIDKVLQADDGINGLQMARAHRPEIILCDVRMPRMNGIDMLKKVEEFLPDTVSIFMSGYSDKEYLKAAIRLKSVTYIEKPLDPAEIREAISEAVRLYRQKQRSKAGEAAHSRQTASSLALALSAPYQANREQIRELSEDLNLDLSPDTFFATVIVRLKQLPEENVTAHHAISQKIRDFLSDTGLHCLLTEKQLYHMVWFLFGPDEPSSALWERILHFMHECYSVCGQFYITMGDVCYGVSEAYTSYVSAVVRMQSCFFFPAGTIRMPEEAAPDSDASAPLPSWETMFSKALLSENHTDCVQFLDELFHYYNERRTLMPNQVREQYYRLFITLDNARRQKNLPTPSEKTDTIVDAIENSFSYMDLHQALTERVGRYLDDADHAAPENTSIARIKDYISRHYMSETLSVRDISEHVFLSVSYVCTLFKNETGQTLNQYLTEYRMEKAKELLEDPRYKISDISAKVGYSDGNYFGKSFRKYTGLSPSEYREKMIR
ncbi:MAG: response regulator [Lachnospiraceae bacterium]|nr:response regulator [Lachnospiraceae bacterium]